MAWRALTPRLSGSVCVVSTNTVDVVADRYATKRLRPDVLVDMATLTGAQGEVPCRALQLQRHVVV